MRISKVSNYIIISLLFVLQENICCTTNLCNEYLIESRYGPPLGLVSTTEPVVSLPIEATETVPIVPTLEQSIPCVCTRCGTWHFFCSTSFGCASTYEQSRNPFEPYRIVKYCIESETRNDCTRPDVICCYERLCNNRNVPPPPDTVERELLTTAAVNQTDPIDSTTESDGEWCGVCV